MEEIKRLAVRSDPLLACCMCRGLLHHSVLLACLHSCCQRCFNEAASKSNSRDVECSTCGAVTHTGAEQPNRFVDQQVRCYTAMTESSTCNACSENGDAGKPAVLWCTECQRSLCEGCVPAHRTFFRNHTTQLLEQLKDFDAMSLRSAAPTCPVHSRPLEIGCLNCKKVKCLSCWIECHENKHIMHVIGDHSSKEYLEKLVASLSSMEKTLLQKSVVLKKPAGVISALKAARADHLKQIEQRKRRVVDAVEQAYQEIEYSTKNAYDDLEKEAEDAAAEAERLELTVTRARDYVKRLVDSHSKCDIFDQQKVVLDQLTALSIELDKLSALISASRKFTMESTLSEDFEHLIKSWIGVPQVHAEPSSSASSCPHPSGAVSLLQAQASSVEKAVAKQRTAPLQKNKLFARVQSAVTRSLSTETAIVRITNDILSSNDSARLPCPPPPTPPPPRPLPAFDNLGNVYLPVSFSGVCSDVASTSDGRLLFAAKQLGLIELRSSGGELSCWQPPPGPAPPDGGDGWPGRDSVQAVAVTSTGSVVVGLHWSRVVAVFWRRGRSGQSKVDDTWAEDYRLEQLRWRPERLSVQGNVLAVAGCLRWGTLLLAEASEQVRLAVKDSRGYFQWQSANELSLGYRTAGLAVTPRVVITASRDLVQLGCGRAAQVVDAHSQSFDANLWRRCDLCEDDEEIHDVCADAAVGVVYAALFRRDQSGGRLAVLSLDDGSTLQRVALTFKGIPMQNPQYALFTKSGRLRLSLSDEVQQQQQARSSAHPWCVVVVLYSANLATGRTATMYRRRVE